MTAQKDFLGYMNFACYHKLLSLLIELCWYNNFDTTEVKFQLKQSFASFCSCKMITHETMLLIDSF